MNKPNYLQSKSNEIISFFSKFISQILWTVFFFAIFGAQQLSAWPLVKGSGWGGGSAFIDLRSVLHAAKCSEQIGWDIYDPNRWGDCGYIYGSALIRVLRWLNLGPEFTLQIGWIFIFFYSILSGYVFSTLKNLSRLQLIASVLVIVNPCSMLLLERGNFDILLILLLFIGAIFLQKNLTSLGICLISLSALFKFYTLPILFLVSFHLRTQKRIATSVLISLIVVMLVVKDIISIKGDFPNNVMASFGNQIFGEYLNYADVSVSRLSSDIIGLLGISICASAAWLISKQHMIKVAQHFRDKKLRTITDYVIALFSSTHLICFFAGINYDYRIPYLIISTLLILPTLISLTVNSWPIILVLIAICWTSFNVGVLQVLGDVLVLITTSYWVLLYLIYFQTWQLALRVVSGRVSLNRPKLLKKRKRFLLRVKRMVRFPIRSIYLIERYTIASNGPGR